MRTVVLLSILVFSLGLVSAQNVTTDVPDKAFQNNLPDLEVNSDFSSYERFSTSSTISNDQLELNPNVNINYVLDYPSGDNPDERFRGELILEYQTDSDLEVVLVETDGSGTVENSEIIQTFDSNTGFENETINWRESLLEGTSLDFSSDNVYLGFDYKGLDNSATIESVTNVVVEDTYQETFSNGNRTTSWSPISGQYSDWSLVDNQIVEESGDYYWEFQTNGFYGIQKGLDDITINNLQYWTEEVSVPEGGTMRFGLRSTVANDPTDITYGYEVDGSGEIYVINDGSTTSESISSTSVNNPQKYHMVFGGIGVGERFSASPELSGSQVKWDNAWNGQNWYWRSGNVIPQTHSAVEFDALVFTIRSNSEEVENFYLGNVTYGPTLDETEEGGIGDIGEGETIDDIDQPNEIIDGGLIDSTIRMIANFLGIGLKATRLLLTMLISLTFGLAVGWNEEYGSVELGSVVFGTTFLTLMLIGLTPMIEGLIFSFLIGISGWLLWKKQANKVVVNE